MSTSEYFNKVVGLIEDIVISDEFQSLQKNFMEKYYKDFDCSEENKIAYTYIFEEYTRTIETFIVETLNRHMKGAFDMNEFAEELMNMKQQLDGEIFELLFSLTDFLTFKEMILDYKLYKEGAFQDMSTGIIIKRLSDEDDNVIMDSN